MSGNSRTLAFSLISVTMSSQNASAFSFYQNGRRPHRLSVRTAAFQAVKRGSTPLGATVKVKSPGFIPGLFTFVISKGSRTGRSEPFREGETGECRRMRVSEHSALPRATKSSADDEAELPLGRFS